MKSRFARSLIIIYLAIPLTTVLLCRVFKIAQGEKNEEIVFGIMLGIFLDFICSIFFTLVAKYKRRKR